MKEQNIIIITGISKGLGEGLAHALIHENNHIIGISRTENDDLKKQAQTQGAKLDFILFDLAYTYDIGELFKKIMQLIDNSFSGKLILVNNAGIIQPIGPIEDCEPEKIQAHININLTAPMLLINEFIKSTKNIKCDKRIMNISSGAAQSPYFGWSSYCTGKAGLDMLTKVVALEQKREKYPAKIMSLAPGIIETGMQTIIRSTSDEQFPLRNKFIEFKESGQLVSPEQAGSKIAEILLASRFENGSITDIR